MPKFDLGLKLYSFGKAFVLKKKRNDNQKTRGSKTSNYLGYQLTREQR